METPAIPYRGFKIQQVFIYSTGVSDWEVSFEGSEQISFERRRTLDDVKESIDANIEE